MAPAAARGSPLGPGPPPSAPSRSSLQSNEELRAKWKHVERSFYTHIYTGRERGKRCYALT